MTSEPTVRARLSWPLIFCAALGLPALYVASFGPAMRVARSHKALRRPVAEIYWPLGRVATRGNSQLLRWYASLFAPPVSGHMSREVFEVPVGRGNQWAYVAHDVEE